MAIFNMVAGGSSGLVVPIAGTTNLSATKGEGQATIKRTDPSDCVYNGVNIVLWTKSVLVRKVGSAPTSPTDGTVVLTETTRNQYSSTGYTNTGLTNGITYYYAVFSYGDNGTITRGNVVSVTPDLLCLCFTANTAGSTVKFSKSSNGVSGLTFEITTNGGQSWSNYTLGSTITLSSVGSKVYIRNKSTTTTGLNNSVYDGYSFSMTGSINASGDVTSLINKNNTTALSGNYCFATLFNGCSSLKTPPLLPATTLTYGCYYYMFYGCGLTKATPLPATALQDYCYFGMFMSCTSLTQLINLPATTLKNSCYGLMFNGCSKIKISKTFTSGYYSSYRVPKSGTGTTATDALLSFFTGTGGTWKNTIDINTTYYYYTSENSVVG